MSAKTVAKIWRESKPAQPALKCYAISYCASGERRVMHIAAASKVNAEQILVELKESAFVMGEVLPKGKQNEDQV